jgi:hypothetical protein
MSDFLEFAQTLQMALKSRLMYTAAHPRSEAALDALTANVEGWLREKPTFHVAASGGKVFVDSQPFEGQSIHLTAVARTLADRQISGVIFSQGVTRDEISELLELFSLKPPKIEERGGAARILEERNLQHIRLGQTQYREVREGEGGKEDHGGPSMHPLTVPAGEGGKGPTGEGPGGTRADEAPGPAGPSPTSHGPKEDQPPMDPVKAMADQWSREFAELLERSRAQGGAEGGLADLSPLAQCLAATGLGDGFPTAQQMEALRGSLLGLLPDEILDVVGALDSLPPSPAGLRMGLHALAPEAFAKAATDLIEGGGGSGPGWERLRERLHGILSHSSAFQSLLAGLEQELRMRGLGLSNLQELVQRLDWDTRGLDEQIRMVLERDHLWKLSQNQRVDFLRQLLSEGRAETFAAVLDMLVKALSSDFAPRREMAARTLAAVAGWLHRPGLPSECEGPFFQGLAAHFAWEPIASIHHASREAFGAALEGLIERGEPGQGLLILQELESLCQFMESQDPWRLEALAWLRERLAQPAALLRVMELLHTATPETLLTEFIPFLEAVGPRAGELLVEVLGEEQDRKRRIRLMEVIRGLGDLAKPAVHASLDSEKWYLVRNTLNLLADMGDVDSLEPAKACLRHPDGRVKRAAVRAVWKLGGPEAAPALISAFHISDPETLLEIMFAFGQIRATAAVPLLGQFLNEKRMPERLRVRAAETLGLIGDPSAIEPLVEVVRRKGRFITSAEPTGLRVAGCRALASLGSPRALEALRQLVGSEPRNSDRPLLQEVLDGAKP